LATGTLQVTRVLATSTAFSAEAILILASDSGLPFEVQDNEILYEHTETLNCQYVIEGQILSTQEEILNKIIINIRLIDEALGNQTTLRRPNDNGHWQLLLPNLHPANYEIWLTHQGSEAILSPSVIVPTQGCDNNRAGFNFVQVSLID